MAGDTFGNNAPVRQVGHAEQTGEVDDDEQQDLGEAKAHPGISSVGSSTRPQ